MNTKYLIAVLAALLGAASAFAQPTVPANDVTRARVIAEIVQARADGTLPLSEAAFLQNQLGSVPLVTHTQGSVAKDCDADAKPALTAAIRNAGAKR